MDIPSTYINSTVTATRQKKKLRRSPLMRKNIAIICNLDGFGNSVAPLGIKKYLEEKGHKVDLINTFYISRFKINENIKFIIPPSKVKIYFVIFLELLSFLAQNYILHGHKYYNLLLLIMKVRSSILTDYFKKNHYDILICEDPIDSYFLLRYSDGIKIYHCQTPYADELYFGGQLLKKDYLKIKSLEINIYNCADYLSFPWESYAEYVKKYYNYQGKNIITLNNGTDIKSDRAKFIYPPKIVYFGYLGGYWINLPLISRLSKIYKNIDVYGYPPPDKKYGLNYKGYATMDILSNYQFGLISITKDRLRKEGFSAKHIDYLSYGLPVLTPEWRRDPLLESTSIYYSEDNFVQVINKYSQENEWKQMSEKGYESAKQMKWENVLKPLDTIINNS